MKLLMFTLFFQSVAGATTLTTQIHEVVLATPPSTDALIFSEVDGRVYHVNQASDLLNSLQIAEQFHNSVTLTLTDEKNIVDVKVLPVFHSFAAPQPNDNGKKHLKAEPSEYIPTVIDSRDLMYKYLNELTPPSRFYARSQCYRRAHVWAYDLYKYDQVKSMKVVLFFTKKYIREYRYDWWFHTAPFIYFIRDGMNEVVFDKEYFPDGGVAMNDWASGFMEKKDTLCPEIKRYQDYEDHQEDAYCYLRKVPMYYYNPAEIEKLDKENITMSDFDPADIFDMGKEMWRRKW